MKKPLHYLLKLRCDNRGASSAEYALILAIVTVGIAAATISLGVSISGAISDSASCFDGVRTANGGQGGGVGGGQGNGNGQGATKGAGFQCC